jgi:glycosyltransferase involved in cell wall biosynthesis
MLSPQLSASASSSVGRLPQPYLLACNIPLIRSGEDYYLDELWLQDLQRHLEYIEHLILFCPVESGIPPKGALPLPKAAPFDRLELATVPNANSLLQALLLAPTHACSAWRAVGRAGIVHGGGIGWPIPLGYYCALSAIWRNRFHVSVMESSPWRALPGQPQSLPARLRSVVMETVASWIARKSQVALFTTTSYRDSMVGRRATNSHVFKASWITADRVIEESERTSQWTAKVNRKSPDLRVGFAARLTEQKGVQVLLSALDHLDRDYVFEVHVVGEGECIEAVRQAASRHQGNVKVISHGKVAYGTPFFSLLESWDLTVVPSLSDEQPRIIYDSFARGVPVVCSDTQALRECIAQDSDGFVVRSGEPRALAECLNKLARDRRQLAAMSVAARATASKITHEQMHAERKAIIERAWLSFMNRGH